MQEPISVMYNGVEVFYDEKSDKWKFELRDRERSAQTLTLAKQAIDAPPPKEEKPFVRFEAYKSEWNFTETKYAKVKVTSEAEGGYGGKKNYWVVGGKKRSKVAATDLIEVTDANEVRIKQILGLEKKIKDLRTQKRDLEYQLTKIQ